MKTEEVSQVILKRIAEENDRFIKQNARAYIILRDNSGKEFVIWLVQGTLDVNHATTTDIVGNVNTIHFGSETILRKTGEKTIAKNSPFGNALAELEKNLGMISYKNQEHKEIKQNVIINSSYVVDKIKVDAVDGWVLNDADNGIDFANASLKKALENLEALNELLLRSKEEGKTEEEIAALKNSINSLEEEIKDKKKQARKRRRTTETLRPQFFLDKLQNIIKRSKLFNGPILINGGPGTGKTTLAIHRIRYMLDPEVENEELLTIKPSAEVLSYVRDQRTGWIFFSPTDLLKKYLEGTMSLEGLQANDDTVRTWEQHKASLIVSMGLFNQEKGRPFQQLPKDYQTLSFKSAEISKLQSSFDSFLNKFFIEKLKRVNSQKVDNADWQKDILAINNSLNQLVENFRFESLIITLNNLSNRFVNLRTEIEKSYKELISDVSIRVQQRLTEDEKKWFTELLRERRKAVAREVAEVSENEDDDTNEEEQEELETAFEEEEQIEGKVLDVDINKLIKRTIRNLSLSKKDKNTKIGNNDKIIIDKISKYLNIFEDRYSNLGSHALFLKYYKPILKGADNFILTQFARIYKAFRKEALPLAEWMSKKMKAHFESNIKTAPKNTRVSTDETDLIIYLALRMARMFFNTVPSLFRSSGNSILGAYRTYMKGLVAIDEATDFTPAQLGCMYLLSRPGTNSVTLSGDLMQQMNSNGIGSWDELDYIMPGIEKFSLKISYRQTPPLLRLAIELYKNRYGVDPEFVSSEEDNDDDPQPLVLIEPDFNKQIDWIAKRIAEVYNIYENQIPNIAVFAKNNEEVLKIADALNKTTTFINYVRKAKACIGDTDIGNANDVRVFNINLIKGMEFETVFFMNVDDYENNDQDIIDKLIYVGVSRATYYLAITLKHKFPDKLMPIKKFLKEDHWDFDNYSDY